MRIISYIIFIFGLAIFTYRQQDAFTKISNEGKTAESVYLTHDQNSRPVVVWTERDADQLTLFFSISKDNGQSFTEKTGISITSDVATHSEGMPKVAFKKDGTIIAAYEKKMPTKDNKYAGAIFYTMSHDGGRSWTRESFMHTDSVEGKSRSYFDIERLPNGEIGASWLDIKLNNQTGGRSVRFARTTPSKGFGNEILVDSSACQCCRIDVYSDMTGRANIAYRGIANTLAGKSIRDMMLATSDNNGESFSLPMKISQDNWSIDGCPHTGPSLCSSKSGLYSLWYTEGNGTGIYYSFKQNEKDEFNERQLISNSGRHPQLGATESRFIMVWEENSGKDNQVTRVNYQINEGSNVAKHILTPDNTSAFAPVVTPTSDGFVIAFLMETKSGTVVRAAKVSSFDE